MIKEKKRIVIVGGGFAGSYCAKNLEDDFDVTLVDTKNYFEFTPSVLRSLVNPKRLDKIEIRHFDYLKDSKIVIGRAKKIDDKYVYVGTKKFGYDYLIICSGSKYKSPFKEENLILPNRGRELKEYNRRLEDSKKILVVGGGLVGVELSGEILSEYPDKEVTLMHSGSELIPRNSKKSREVSKRFLEKKGVNIIFNKEFSPKEKDKYDLIFFCVGIKPNFNFKVDLKGFKGESLKVNDYLQLKSGSKNKNIFVGGDVAGIKEEKTAQNALEHAKVILRNIERSESGKKLKKYKKKKRVFLISLGKKRGIFEFGNFSWFGRIPVMMKNWVEWEHMKRLKI
jgi:apoptosis-inducing factor 2